MKMKVLLNHVEARITWLHCVLCSVVHVCKIIIALCASLVFFPPCCRQVMVARVLTHFLPSACPSLFRAEVAAFPLLVDHIVTICQLIISRFQRRQTNI